MRLPGGSRTRLHTGLDCVDVITSIHTNRFDRGCATRQVAIGIHRAAGGGPVRGGPVEAIALTPCRQVIRFGSLPCAVAGVSRLGRGARTWLKQTTESETAVTKKVGALSY
jgi:hypothetical protein